MSVVETDNLFLRCLMFKKSEFSECGGDCETCASFSFKCFKNEVVLVKKKVSRKYVPPDMQAIKIILEQDNGFKNPEDLSDKELKDLEEVLINEALRLKNADNF